MRQRPRAPTPPPRPSPGSPGTAYTFTLTASSPAGTPSVSAATTAITSGNETSYTYDPAGNMSSSQADGITTTNTFNADEELTNSATTSYGYGADGNQTSAGGTTYTYNAANELTGASTLYGNFAYGYKRLTTSPDGTELSATVWDLNDPLPEVPGAHTLSRVTNRYLPEDIHIPIEESSLGDILNLIEMIKFGG